MKRYLRMLRNSSFLQTVPASASGAVKAPAAAVFPTGVVQRTSDTTGAPEPRLDVAAIEERARAARSAWSGSKLKSYYEDLVRKYRNAGEAEMENYLAASQRLADLEERIRRYERSRSPYY